MRNTLIAVILLTGLAACGGTDSTSPGIIPETPWHEQAQELPMETSAETAPESPAPTIQRFTPENPQVFASTLEDFLVNLSPPPAPEYSWIPQLYPNSSHAILVDLDGQGSVGMIASKWSYDVQRYIPGSTWEGPVWVQKLFVERYGHVREMPLFDFGGAVAVSSNRRLIAMNFADAQGVSTRGYTLLDFTDSGQLTAIKTISITEYWRREDGYGIQPDHDGNTYFIAHHSPEFPNFWNRDWENDISLTSQEFNELMSRYGLHGTTTDFWHIHHDDTYVILGQ